MCKKVNPSYLFQRYKDNPILTAQDWPYPANSVFNAGATRINDQTLLLLRVEDLRGISHLTAARSEDGLTNWKIDTAPTLAPEPENFPEELWGIEDARIVHLPELQEYAITYTAYGRGGPLVSLAFTRDFQKFKKCGAILSPENKDAALLPRQIAGRWVLIHRPAPSARYKPAHIWLASSPDLLHWGRHRLLMETRAGGWWDSHKIGLGPQPIETPEGWLILYHGVRKTVSGALYRTGLALLDLEQPDKVIKRSQQWVLGPWENFERTGDVPNASFPCGAVVNEKSGELFLYYGAADSCLAVATAKISDLLDFLKQDG
ncbi:MAG: glycosidase [bacterium]